MKTGIVSAALVIIVTILAMPAHAQLIGFRVGIAPPNSPLHPFATSPVAGFGAIPMITPPVPSTFPGPAQFQTGYLAPQPWPFAAQPVAISPNRGVVVVAPGNTVYAPGSTVITGGNTVIITTSGAGSNGRRGSHTVFPAAGSPRSRVIAQFGSPVMSILTMNGETMQFNGGITISLQNGVVVRP